MYYSCIFFIPSHTEYFFPKYMKESEGRARLTHHQREMYENLKHKMNLHFHFRTRRLRPSPILRTILSIRSHTSRRYDGPHATYAS